MTGQSIVSGEHAPAFTAETLVQLIAGLKARRPHNTVTVGICGAQGSGKTTLTRQIKQSLEQTGHRVGLISLDDFYLSKEDRCRLASEVHPLLRARGVPGTHDIGLARSTLEALKRSGVVSLPVFDKARDDCCPLSAWAQVQGPMDIILLEGWCVGALPEDEGALETPVNDLERAGDPDGTWRRYVNSALDGPYREFFSKMDFLILLAAPSFDVVFGWRREQERQLRESRRSDRESSTGIMSDKQLKRFIAHFERLTRHILREMPARADLVVRLDRDRRMTIQPG
jgi:D-glycerate 3-kinase